MICNIMITHTELAVVKCIDDKTIEIIQYTEYPEQYNLLRDYAKENGYSALHGVKREEEIMKAEVCFVCYILQDCKH